MIKKKNTKSYKGSLIYHHRFVRIYKGGRNNAKLRNKQVSLAWFRTPEEIPKSEDYGYLDESGWL